MNVAKNWVLTIMLIALAYRRKIDRFSLNLPPKKSSEIGCFLLIVSWRTFPPEISREIGRFFLEFAHENPS